MRLMRQMRIMRPMGLMGLMGLIGLIGLMSLMSCSSREEPQPTPGEVPEVVQEVSISFSGLESDELEQTAGVKGTRAGQPLSNLGILKFRVWGYKNMTYDPGTGSYDSDPSKMQLVFPGYIVNWYSGSGGSTTTNTNGWEYVAQQESGDDQQTIKYWDFNANAYRYYAVTGTAAADAADLAANPSKYLASGATATNGPTTFTFAADASPEMKTVGTDEVIDKDATALKYARTPFFSKLWFSDGNPEHYPEQLFGKPVQLEFMKPYARVRFIFIYAYPREGTVLGTREFKPTGGSKIIRKGTVTITYPLTGTGTRETFTMVPNDSDDPLVNKALAAFTEDADPEDYSKVYTETDEGWYMVLPNTDQSSYTLTVEVNKRERTCTVPQQYMQWLPGYSYTYIFKILEEGGVAIDMVQSAFTPWSDMRITHEVYNW